MYYPVLLSIRMLVIVYVMVIFANSLVQTLKKIVMVKIIIICNTAKIILLGSQPKIVVHFRASNTSVCKWKRDWQQVFGECSRWLDGSHYIPSIPSSFQLFSGALCFHELLCLSFLSVQCLQELCWQVLSVTFFLKGSVKQCEEGIKWRCFGNLTLLSTLLLQFSL